MLLILGLSSYEQSFWKDNCWIAGFTEMPRDAKSAFMDVDSGPVLCQIGSVSSAFGIGAAKTVGRMDHAAPLTMESVACSWPTPFGFLIPGLMGRLAAQSWSLGEIGLLFSMTRPTSTATIVPFEGHAPLIVWICLAAYTSAGIFLIWFENGPANRLVAGRRRATMDIMTPSDLPPADHWRLRTRTLTMGKLPLLMGIINVTPDSFSDGGHCFDADAAIEHGLRLAAEGADILDIGGESTRPFAHPVDAQEELRRVMPVVGTLVQQTGLAISIDTSKAFVARHAIHAGAEIINDITALRGDPAMRPLAVETCCGICAMHIQGTPQTMQQAPNYADVVAEVLSYLRDCRDALLAAGMDQDRIALDPGIGFGKTTAHNLQLLANAWQFHSLGCPVLIGHSRKRFLETWPNVPVRKSGIEPRALSACSLSHATEVAQPTEPAPQTAPPFLLPDRVAGTIGVALSLARQGVQILRVHDVAAVRQALLFFQSTGGLA